MATAERDVRNWLKALGGLCAGSMPQREAEAKATSYASLLAREFGAECFTPATLTFVARQCKFFPSFGEVAAALSAWWQENRGAELARLAPPEPADWRERYNIPAPRTPPTEAEQAAVAEILSKWRMQTAYAKSRTLPERPQAARAPAQVSDAQLLATYEAMGPAGAVRAAALRAKLEAVPA